MLRLRKVDFLVSYLLDLNGRHDVDKVGSIDFPAIEKDSIYQCYQCIVNAMQDGFAIIVLLLQC